MFNVVVAFSENDLKILSNQLDDKCILISNSVCQLHISRHIIPKLDLNTELELSAKVKEFFELFEKKCRSDLFCGYANNFYECTIAPIYEFIVTLNNLLEDLKKTQNTVVVWFPTKYIFPLKYSAYFMAEHESQGQRFYSREAVFLPYLEEICRRNGAIIKYQKVKLGVHSISQRIFRVAAVLGWRFLWGVRRMLAESNSNILKMNERIDIIAITRTVSQTEFLMPFLIKNTMNIALITGESALGKGKNKALAKKIALKHSQILNLELKISPIVLLSSYLSALWLMFKKPKARFTSHNVTLNLDQAMTEVTAMWPDLLTYRKALQKVVQNIGVTSKKIMLSTEQKSPQAYADAWVAAQCGLICVHLMQCDQLARPLPNPICGDYFLADSNLNAANFARVWGVGVSKVRYIGSFKACNSLKDQSIPNGAVTPRWCFFAAADDIDSNKKVLYALRKISKVVSINISVKLHPRDSKIYYGEFMEYEIYSEGELCKSDLFSNFDYALSFVSGVVLDLIYNNKPFLLLRFGRWDTSELSYIDDEYIGNILKISDLEDKFFKTVYLCEHFNKFQQRFFLENAFIVDPCTILDNLLEITGNGKG